jgi:hypothetical protein
VCCSALSGVQDANLWDVSLAPTIVFTQRGARRKFQDELRSKGVEVVEIDFLTPEAVADYCYKRGFLQVLRCAVFAALPASRVCRCAPSSAGAGRAVAEPSISAGDAGV